MGVLARRAKAHVIKQSRTQHKWERTSGLFRAGTNDVMAQSRTYNVLFLCTGNSARSLIAEAILAHEGAERFAAYSAGSQPKGEPHPEAIALLKRLGHPTGGLTSKSWEAFANPGAPKMDFVFTVCDNAANEMCPIWPGQPSTAHWGLADPAGATGTPAEIAAAFAETYLHLAARITALVNLPMEGLDRISLQKEIDAIGKVTDALHET